MDVTGGLGDAVKAITAALPQVEASIAADLQMALDGIKAELEAAEAAEMKILENLGTELVKLLGADSVAALLADQEGWQLEIGPITVKLTKAQAPVA